MVNSGEALLNVVTKAKRKMLNRLDQKVRGQVWGVVHPLAQMRHHRRRAATFPTLQQRRNVVSPSSSRKGQRTVRPADGAAGKGSGRKRTPACNGPDRGCAMRQHHPPRKRADFPGVFPHERTLAN